MMYTFPGEGRFPDGPGIPRLQFELGNVLMKLSPKPRDWILASRKRLEAISPFFRALFDDKFATITRDVVDPRTGESHVVYVLSLKFDAEMNTFFLEPEDTPFTGRGEHDTGRDRECAMPLSKAKEMIGNAIKPPDYAWPMCVCNQQHDMAVASLKVLFALGLGASFNLASFQNDSYDIGLHESLIQLIKNVLAYADVFMCLPMVKTGLRRKIDESDELWNNGCKSWGDRSVIQRLELAKAIQHKELYLDLIRHHVAITWDMRGDHAPQEWAMFDDILPARDCIGKGWSDNHWSKNPLKDLRKDLMKLALCPVEIAYPTRRSWTPYDARPLYPLDPCVYEESSSERSPMDTLSGIGHPKTTPDYLARAAARLVASQFFSPFLIDRQPGLLPRHHHCSTPQPEPICEVELARIIQAAGHFRSRHHMFGKTAAVDIAAAMSPNSDISDMLRLIREIQVQLNGIATKAIDLVNATLKGPLTRRCTEDNIVDPYPFVMREVRVNCCNHYTLVPLRESLVCLGLDNEREVPDPVEVNTDPVVSSEWFNAVKNADRAHLAGLSIDEGAAEQVSKAESEKDWDGHWQPYKRRWAREAVW